VPAKSETDLIDAGFEEHFGTLYKAFVLAYGSASTTPEQKAAIATFQTHIKLARSVRDAAKKNLP
jgi:hypothetical protein